MTTVFMVSLSKLSFTVRYSFTKIQKTPSDGQVNQSNRLYRNKSNKSEPNTEQTCGSDHDLVVGDIQLKLASIK